MQDQCTVVGVDVSEADQLRLYANSSVSEAGAMIELRSLVATRARLDLVKTPGVRCWFYGLNIKENLII
jgi:hypothetical protein